MGKKNENEDSIFERYKLLVAARNFHYDNFNKWLTYFYVANGALFVGYGQAVSSSLKSSLEIPLLIVGSIAGILLYWSSKGYYYWNINFIMLVNHYEKELLKWKKKERIYSMFGNKKVQNNYSSPVQGANFSTSKIAILFAFTIACAWCYLLLDTIISFSRICTCGLSQGAKHILSLPIAILFVLILTRLNKSITFLQSDTKPLHDLEIVQEEV